MPVPRPPLRFLVPLVLLLAVPAAAQDVTLGSQEPGNRYAVIIGISEYADSAIPDLEFAAEDARAFHEFVRSPAAGFGGFRERNTMLLVDDAATGRAIQSALTTFVRQHESSPRDVLYVFMVAHGLQDPYRPDDLYLLPHDARIGDLPGTALGLQDVKDWILDFGGYQTVVFADVTRAAGIFGNPRSRLQPNRAGAALMDDESQSGAQSYVALLASAPNQISREGEEYGGGHGVFAYYILEGLRGAADRPEHLGDGNSIVTLGELMEYTRDRVRRATSNSQIPTISQTTFDQFWPMAAVIDP